MESGYTGHCNHFDGYFVAVFAHIQLTRGIRCRISNPSMVKEKIIGLGATTNAEIPFEAMAWTTYGLDIYPAAGTYDSSLCVSMDSGFSGFAAVRGTGFLHH
jgi:hypothetical protein